MNEQIVSRDQIRDRGREAFVAGRSRDDHGMNAGALAIAEWQAGWDQACADAVDGA
jgi:ribosome modulation factor